MKVVIFGATGMVGAGVLQECLDDPRVSKVLVIGRTSCGRAHPKLEEILLADFYDYSAIQHRLKNADACFFCLGVSAAGKDEATYRRLTYDLTLAAARAMAAVSDRLTFCYVSGAGTDSTERGRVMWARVKGATENALRRMPFKAAFMFRPGLIEPLKGVKSKTPAYRWAYLAFGPVLPLLRRIAPGQITTTVAVGRAMIALAIHGYPKPILDPQDINRAAVSAG
jgi:uncharacterized protein YbjT (DUF2867 family)